MRTRPFQQSDLSPMADIMAHNNRTDVLSRFMTKDIDRYPFTYRMGCLRFLKGLVLGKGVVTFVTETEQSDTPPSSSPPNSNISTNATSSTKKQPFTPQVVAYALFSRHGTSPAAKSWQCRYNASYACTLNRSLLWIQDRYFKTPPFTHSEHTFSHSNFALILPTLSTPYPPEVFSEAIECLALYTHYAYQKRGIGSNLMQWGKDKAREQGVPVIVSGSPVGGVAYAKMGFESVGEIGLGKWFDELEYGGEVMRRWCWEPDGEGRWVERAREKEREKEEGKGKGEGEEGGDDGVGQTLPTVLVELENESK